MLNWTKNATTGDYYADNGGFSIRRSSGRFILWQQVDPAVPAERLFRGSLADCKSHAQQIADIETSLNDSLASGEDIISDVLPEVMPSADRLTDAEEEGFVRSGSVEADYPVTIGRFGEETDPGRPDPWEVPDIPIVVGNIGLDTLYATSDGLSWNEGRTVTPEGFYARLTKGEARAVRKLLRSKGLNRLAAAKRVVA